MSVILPNYGSVLPEPSCSFVESGAWYLDSGSGPSVLWSSSCPQPHQGRAKMAARSRRSDRELLQKPRLATVLV